MKQFIILFLIATSLGAAVPAELKKLSKDHRPINIEQSYLIDGESTKKLWDTGHALLIDVRQDNEPVIPGTIRIPSYALKTNKALQKKKLILINEGYGYKEAINTCKKSGIPWIKCLKGGIHGWLRAGGTIVGKKSELRRIPPAKLFFERNLEEVKILTLDEDKRELFPLAISLPTKSPAKQIAAVAKDLAERKETAYVVLACSKKLEQQIRAETEKSVKPIFFIKGGRKAYKKWLFMQAKVLRQYKVREEVQGCPTCR